MCCFFRSPGMSKLLTMPEKVQWTGWLAHKQEALRTLEARSPAERAKLESTCLLQLQYFDPSRMLVIDPMHDA